jgi:hypothetical protein
VRRFIVVGMLVALLVAAVGGTALAKGQGRGGADRATFNFKGTVVSASSDAVVVDVEDGNKKARAFEGQQLSIAVTEDTRVERDDVRVAITDLAAGEEVRVQSKAPRDATEFSARKVDAKGDSDDSSDSDDSNE